MKREASQTPRWFPAFVRAIFFSLVLLLLSSVAPPAARAEQLPLRGYTSTDGLFADGISRIVEDSRGFLWLCASSGLSRFDGYSFVNYEIADGSPSLTPSHLVETGDGGFLVNGGTGVYLLRAGASTEGATGESLTLHTAPGILAAGITRLIKMRSGEIYFTINGRFYQLRVSGGQVEYVEMEMGGEIGSVVYAMAEDAEGSLWLGVDTGLVRWLPERRLVHYRLRFDSTRGRVSTIAVDRHNRLWLNTPQGLALCRPEAASAVPTDTTSITLQAQIGVQQAPSVDSFYEPSAGSCSVFTANEGIPKGALAICAAADGKLWLGTYDSGIYLLDGRQARNFTRANGLLDNSITSITADSFGNIWLSSPSGVMKLPPAGFTNYSTTDGLGHDYTLSLFTTGGGAVCALTLGGYINVFDGYRFTAVTVKLPQLPSAAIISCLQDRAGVWWLGTSKGLFQTASLEDPQQLATAKVSAVTADGIAGTAINSLFEDSRGDLWISLFGAKRLAHWRRATGVFEFYTQADGLPPAAIDRFCEDAAGNIWMTERNGHLLRFRHGRFDKIIYPTELVSPVVSGVHRDAKGRLWVALNPGGLKRIDEPTAATPEIFTYRTTDGLSSNQTRLVTEDARGRIYVLTSRGMDRLDPESGRFEYFTRTEGLLSTNALTAVRDRQGALWFGMRQGISRFVPETATRIPAAPTFIKSVRVAGRLLPISPMGETEISDIQLAPDERQVQIDFFGLSLAAGETLSYQYRLEDTDREWSALTRQRSVTFANMAPGSYRFLVRAVLSDGSVSQQMAAVSFTVLRPLWQRWWFLLGVLALALMTSYAAYRYRLRQLVRVERVRTRIASDLHDDIGASLSRMAILSEVVKQQTGALNLTTYHMLTEIADSSRSLVDSMSDIVWSIDPRKDHLKSVVQRLRQFASDVLEARGIRWTFETPPELDQLKLSPDERRQLYLIFKEAINNIAKHSGCTEAQMRIFLESGKLCGEAVDNGCGFRLADPESSFIGMGGNGLKNMQARAAEVGGRLEIASEPGGGTRLLLLLPVGRGARMKRRADEEARG